MMTNYHPDVQRAYESHCADGYVVPDDETGPQEATGATVRDFPCCDAPRGGEAAERRTEDKSVIERAIAIIRPILGPWYDGKAAQSAFALADAGLLADGAAQDRLCRARDTAAALEAENARLTSKVERVERLACQISSDTGCDCLSCLTQSAVARDINRALSDTTGEATSETRAGAGVYGRLPGRLCDPDGWVRAGFWHHGTDYQCTGSAHLGSTEIVCTNPVHDQPDTTGEAS